MGTQILRLRRSASIQLLGWKPWRVRPLADEVAIADASDPIPASLCNEPKPWVAKSGVGQNDRRQGAGRQYHGQSIDKAPMYSEVRQMATRMHFLIQRQTAPFDDHRGPQPVPAHVCTQARPIDHDQQLRQVRQPPPRKRCVNSLALDTPMCIAQQPIHALDAVPQRRRACGP